MSRLPLLLILWTSLLFASAHAVPIHVDADATGAKDGSSWADAYPDLQDALAAAAHRRGQS